MPDLLHRRTARPAWCVRGARAGIGIAAAIGWPAAASAATLQLSVQPDQVPAASAVTVKATGTAANPSSCAPGIGCELTVFVIRQGSCPTDPTLLLGDTNLVVFETVQGLPALVGTSAGPFSVAGTYLLNGAPNGAGEAKASDGDGESPWGTFTFCGYLQDARALVTFTNRRPDELAVSGPGHVHLAHSRFELYSVSCAELPCRIELEERAFARGKHIVGLDRRKATPIIEGPTSDGAYGVWFARDELRQPLLGRTIAHNGSLELRFRATVVDAAGGRTVAARTILLRSSAAPRRTQHSSWQRPA